MKCRYKYCKLGGEVEKDVAVKIGSAYYHKECNREMNHKKQIEELYHNKFKLNENIMQVRSAINKYIEEFETSYILFVMNEDIKLNSIYGISYYLKDNRFKDKYKKEKAKLIEFDINEVKIEEPISIKYKKPKNKLWGDIICK